MDGGIEVRTDCLWTGYPPHRRGSSAEPKNEKIFMFQPVFLSLLVFGTGDVYELDGARSGEGLTNSEPVNVPKISSDSSTREALFWNLY